MTPVLHTHLPHSPWSDPALSRLPGMRPLTESEWLIVDEAFAGQMALRDQMLAERRAEVLQVSERAGPAATELLQIILGLLANTPGYVVGERTVMRPDRVEITTRVNDPLLTIGRLVQEDFCLMQYTGTEHVLTGAVLCFPANWTLAEKFQRPMVSIHSPVVEYDENIARRVQRMLDAIRPERGLWRVNVLPQPTSDLFCPRREGQSKDVTTVPPRFVRSERQSLMRLPDTGAVVFSIHTYLLRHSDLTDAQQDAMAGANG